MSELVSVIIPTFNRSTLLLRAVDSLLNQSYKSMEIIIVDDGSTDNSRDVLDPLINSNRIKYIYQKNQGVSSARNIGVQNSFGTWVAFLDSDDEWLKDKLAKQMIFFKSNPNLKIVYTDEVWIKNGVRINQSKHHQKCGGYIFAECLKQCLIGPSSVVIKKDLFLELNGFDINYPVCEDYDLWLKISSRYEIGFINETLVTKYGGHSDQLSTTFVAMDMWRLKSMNKLFSLKTISEKDRKLLIEEMGKKGNILKKGFQKYGNTEALNQVNEILKNLK